MESDLQNLVEANLEYLLESSYNLRYRHFGNELILRTAYNAFPRGKCSGDCRYCAVSATSPGLSPNNESANLEKNKKKPYTIGEAVKFAAEDGAELEIASNTERVTAEDYRRLIELIELIETASAKVKTGVQPGIVDNKEYFAGWKNAGLDYYSNNIETSPKYFREICTSHRFEEKIASLEMAKKIGLETWSGLCIGIEKSWGQRIEAILALQEYQKEGVIDGVNLNLFYGAGLPLNSEAQKLAPQDYLRVIAITRIAMPETPIVIGGKMGNLGQLKNDIYKAGANGYYIGKFLNFPAV